MSKNRIVRLGALLAGVMGAAGFVMLTVPLCGQTIVPVDKSLPAPMGLNFRGRLGCDDTVSKATLEVEDQHHAAWLHRSRGFGDRWTRITESEANLVGHYLVGFDHDKNQFVIVDAVVPAYATYRTDGWHEGNITLVSKDDVGQLMPTHRFIYEVITATQFTITLELSEGTEWVTQTLNTCNRIGYGRYTLHP